MFLEQRFRGWAVRELQTKTTTAGKSPARQCRGWRSRHGQDLESFGKAGRDGGSTVRRLSVNFGNAFFELFEAVMGPPGQAAKDKQKLLFNDFYASTLCIRLM
ncbi:hypothetical protein [Bordetella trematum]|uniref:hypothetical protein n=1 Tax=Bordetella trematum TaxID=123899 RepID=UPI0015C543DD|nr:hypothetical protein [Bordetella trematum]